MKSLLSIIKKFSQNEVETFRRFLSGYNRGKKNKKLELFNYLVTQGHDFDDFQVDKKNSRQSIYQLKKRLQEDLYSFLLSQQQTRNCNDEVFLEMDCHKKLYCFKILFDKGVHEHARQILDDVLNISAKHYLHNIYLEAVGLKNAYFPLTKLTNKGKIQVNTQIKKLRRRISRGDARSGPTRHRGRVRR
jgi:hypothetical protein